MPQRSRSISFAVLLLALAMRVVVPIDYIADPDSLRFALALVNFDVVALQPHFPGYPVFVFLASLMHTAGLTMPTLFALIGGFATWVILLGFLRMVNTSIASKEGLVAAVLILFNPMIVVMSARYMPDLLGAGVALWVIVLSVRERRPNETQIGLALLLAGLLAGIRLSYLPLVVLPVIAALIRSRKRIVHLAIGLVAVAVWLVPMIGLTGFDEFVGAAERQTKGHFTEFGGTIVTEPSVENRRIALVNALFIDGFGATILSRSPTGFPLLLCLLLAGILGTWWLFGRDTDGLLIVILSISLYLAWVLLYQNIIYQPRHILPLVPLILAPIWAGCVVAARRRRVATVLVVAILALTAITGIDLAIAQTRPTAIAQASEYLRSIDRPVTIVSSGLVCTMLERTGVSHQCVDVATVDHLSISPRDTLVVTALPLKGGRDTIFYHRSNVNRIWPKLWIYGRTDKAGDSHSLEASP